MSAAPFVTAADRLDRDRQHHLEEVVSLTVGQHGLDPEVEVELWSALMRLFDPILEAADSAVAVRAELGALDRRLRIHLREHGCLVEPCDLYRLLRDRRQRLQRRADSACMALVRGRR